jgi:lipoprotein-anchoring transpeptidase ErfK/SrfK
MSETTGNDIGGATPARGRRRSKRLRWLWPVAAVIVVAAAVGVFLLVQDARSVGLGAISPAPDSLLGDRPLTISCELSHFVPGRGSVVLTVDGQPLPAADVILRPGAVQARLTLPDGRHTVALAYDSGNLFSRHLSRTWTFGVDTSAPVVTVDSPSGFPLLGARSTDIALQLSEPATASLTLDGADVPVHSGGSAATEVRATLVADEGEHVLAVAATDEAGNLTTQQWNVVVDYQAPRLTVVGLPDAEVWNHDNSAAVDLSVSDSFVDQVKVAVAVDGASVTLKEGAAASEDEREFAFETDTLAEGTHDIEVSATDRGGHVTTLKRGFLVDTSSVFGARTLKAGAQGEDVKQLQRILKIKGVYTGDVDGTLGESTAVAVAAFNSQCGLPAGEVVTEQTLKYLLGYVRIDLSERKLYLYSGDDQVVKTYRVAVGMPGHPTPTGAFRIITKQKNPTWNPPDSAWAAGMGPVPPGPGNPLGTRWMGLNSPGIGIHGTPAPSSIGTAASHGCIRMRIPEAEDLFDRVFVGTPVEIVQ